MRFRFLPALALVLAAPAASVPVTVTVSGADGRPLADAVVSVEVPGVAAPPVRGPYAIAQRNIAFVPHVLVVPVGATVSFPNQDKVRHHVYSFSPVRRFELKLYGRDETKSVAFDRPGLVALGCNIHDAMSGFLYVTPTPFFAITDQAGRAAIANVPAGRATLRVSHAAIRAPGNSLVQPATIGARGLSTTVALRR